jgi:diacylglycerol kinase (ATP)
VGVLFFFEISPAVYQDILNSSKIKQFYLPGDWISMQQAYLAYNPAAGRYPSRMLSERAANVLREYGWKVKLEQTNDGTHITRLARQAADAGMDAFFMAGGDGSLNQAISGLIGSDTALGVLPAGTANVWAQELGLPGLTWTRWMALEESARLLAIATTRHVDIGLCNQRPFLLWAGVGLDAFIVHRIEPRARWEKHFAVVQYAASMVWNAGFWHGMNLRVEIEGTQINGHFLLAVINNVHLYAGGFAELSPDARLDDGLMELWLFEGETLGDTVQLAWELLGGNHLQSPQVQKYTFQTLRMESDSTMYVQVDGEPAEGSNPLNFSILPKSLRVLVPQKTPHPLFMDVNQQNL